MNSFFRSIKNVILSLATVAAIASMGMASAETATSTCTGCLPSTTTAPAMGLTVQGWVQSGSIGVGETSGTGQTVTGEVMTMTDEAFSLNADTFLTGNAQADCTVDCKDSQSKLSITGFSKVGAASLGYAGFEGSSCASGNCPLSASSVSQTGTNGVFKASLFQTWQGTAIPTTTTAQ